MNLPKPKTEGDISLEGAIRNRRTIRSFKTDSLSIEQFSQILWAGQGITEQRGYKRSAPSGGALYPMDIYAVIGRNGVTGIKPGIYHYNPSQHSVSKITEGDLLHDVARAALSQMWLATAPINLLITAEYSRICSKYGERGVRYAVIEAGHISQNIFLQAEAIGLGAGIVGAFYDETIIRAIKIPISHEPLLIMPVGYKS
ncbi:MAG: SagB/ThcOx family dehydrogenase [Thermodesulfobacteriota bacterium]|nr:SagB/ThcOx family dehydrogenase [Thermodesulfobacteriota bacterium]